MRQAGVVAAAGLEAVVNNYVRLSEVRVRDEMPILPRFSSLSVFFAPVMVMRFSV